MGFSSQTMHPLGFVAQVSVNEVWVSTVLNEMTACFRKWDGGWICGIKHCPGHLMSMPTPQSLFVLLNLVSLFTSHMKGWISWDSITVAAIRCTLFSVIWIKLVSCLVTQPDSLWWHLVVLETLNREHWDFIMRQGMEWMCFYSSGSKWDVNCSLIEVMGILYFVLLNPAACHPAGCIKTFSSIWRAQASDERWWCQKYHHTVIVIMEQRISWLLEISWTHSQTLNQLKCEPQDWLWQPQGKVGAWGSDGIMWVAEESWLSFV